MWFTRVSWCFALLYLPCSMNWIFVLITHVYQLLFEALNMYLEKSLVQVTMDMMLQHISLCAFSHCFGKAQQTKSYASYSTNPNFLTSWTILISIGNYAWKSSATTGSTTCITACTTSTSGSIPSTTWCTTSNTGSSTSTTDSTAGIDNKYWQPMWYYWQQICITGSTSGTTARTTSTTGSTVNTTGSITSTT